MSRLMFIPRAVFEVVWSVRSAPVRPWLAMVTVVLGLVAWAVLGIAAPGSPDGAGLGIAGDEVDCLGELTAGYRALDAGDFERAVHHYRLALQKASNAALRFQALLGLGSSYAAMGRAEDAAPVLEQANELQPEHIETLYLLGGVYAANDRIDQAVATLEEVVRRAPELIGAHHDLSLLYAGLDWHEQAAATCRKTLALDPRHLEARIGLAVALYHLESYQEAANQFSLALEGDRVNPRALYGLGLSLLFADEKEAAVEQYLALRPIDEALAEDLYGRIMQWDQ